VDAGPIFDSTVCDLALDADHDSLADFFETCTGVFVNATDTGTCPDVSDSDGDGHTDFAELQAGSSPVDAQSIPAPSSVAVPSLGRLELALLAGGLALVGIIGAARLRQRLTGPGAGGP
jgi:hypothetical protein